MDLVLVILGTIVIIILFNAFRKYSNGRFREQRIEKEGIYGETSLLHLQGLEFPLNIKCNVRLYKDYVLFTYQNNQVKLDIKKIQSASLETTKGNYLCKSLVIGYINKESVTEYISLIPSYPNDSNGAVKIMSNWLSEFHDALEKRIVECNGVQEIRSTEL